MSNGRDRFRLRLNRLLMETEMTRDGHETADDALDLLARLISVLLDDANDDSPSFPQHLRKKLDA